MKVVRSWKVYGADGHRQMESFNESYNWDFSFQYDRDYICIIEVKNFDKTGIHDYSVVKITTDSFEHCEEELNRQLIDGIFENSRVGEVIEITE